MVSGKDSISVGEDNDRVFGSVGNDHVFGDEGNGYLYGDMGRVKPCILDAAHLGGDNDKLYGRDEATSLARVVHGFPRDARSREDAFVAVSRPKASHRRLSR
ncbi:autotransporter [Rhizobium leguminosarum bv. trifolii]|nr:autotransporter [Rhizobium leguminosarum bv. trifolii]